MNKENVAFNLKFLAGGGEMGELTRKKDWSKTPVGSPENWPQSLRTTLSIILNSKFPMFLWWGPELTCFYNDAYRPSLGENGKHPSILGQKAENAWPEIWSVIKPLIDQVLAGGEATWSEDQLIPIFRNGKLEDVYWTFSYSPVKDESDNVAGVLVTCSETTNKVKEIMLLESNNKRYFSNIMQAPVAICILSGKDHVVEIVNEKMLEIWGKTASETLNKPVFEGLPEAKDQGLEQLLDHVFETGEKFIANERPVNLLRNGKIETVYQNFTYEALRDSNGTISGVVAISTDVTAQVIAREKAEDSEQKTRTIVENAPFPIGVYVGREMRIELANQSIIDVWGKGNDVIGKLYSDILPELENQKIFSQLDGVFTTGTPFHAYNQRVDLNVNGKLSPFYFNYSFTPLYDSAGNIYGVMNTAANVTDLNLAKEKIEENEKRFRNVVEQAPLGIAIFRGPDFVAEMANDSYLQLVDKKEHDFVGRPLFESLPEVKEIVNPLLTGVYKTGMPFYATELGVMLNRYGKTEQAYFNLVYHPLREDNGDISGIIVVATEVTESVKAKHSLAESERQFRNLVMQSPIPMTIFRGKDHIIEVANTTMFEGIWRKKANEVIGKKVLDVFPELNDQKYPELLNNVLTTGITHSESESIAYIQGDDGLRKFYLDFEYAPLFETDNSISGVIITVNDVTEKVEARQRIEDNQQKLNMVIDASELGTWELDLITRNVVYSDRYIAIFGYDKNVKLTHEQIIKHLHPDDLHIREEAYRRAYDTGVFNYQSRLIHEDKSIHWFETKGKVIYDQENKPVKMIGTIRDITEEKNYRQVLQEREQKFRLLADSMPQFVWTSDAEGHLNYFNKSVYNYSGLTPEQIEKEGWLQIVHPDERDENVKQWLQSINTGEVFIFEHRFKRYDGEYRWQLSRAIPQRDEQGNITMWVGTSTDIQDQKLFTYELEKEVESRTRDLQKLNEDLVKSEARYHLMIDEVQDYAIIYLNQNGDIENWNKGAEKIKGYTADEIIGKNFSVFYTEQDQKANTPKKLLNQALTSGKVTHEGWRVRKDGTFFWANIAITAIHDESSNIIGFSKVTHDLTEKKQASDQLKINSEQLEQKNKELEKMNAELQSFAYVSSHDLQEPLRKIQTFANRILEKEYQNLSDAGKDYFSRMQKAANRMQLLIEDLLDYSRTNTSERIFKDADIKEIITDVKNEFKDTISEKNAVIEVEIPQRATVIPFQFRQLIHNLIGNSLKFSKPDTPPHITLKSEIVQGSQSGHTNLMANKNYFHLTVSDNGIGFESQYKDRIFEVFQRLHGKTEYKGTGIGLAIVKKIVENHNGLIVANGEVNKGARFDIYIPV